MNHHSCKQGSRPMSHIHRMCRKFCFTKIGLAQKLNTQINMKRIVVEMSKACIFLSSRISYFLSQSALTYDDLFRGQICKKWENDFPNHIYFYEVEIS